MAMVDRTIATHVGPDQILAANMIKAMYGSANESVGPYLYPRSPYGSPIIGLGWLAMIGDDCSSLEPPSAPTYQNCGPQDENCVAQNAQADSQYNADVQSYHDEQAACSAEKYAESGGTLTPSALTYGAAQDLLNPSAAPYVQPVGTVQQFTALIQPYQTSQQTAAESAAMPNTPTMATAQQVAALQNLTPSAAPTQAPASQPGVVPASTGVTPASQSVPQTVIPTGSSASSSSASSSTSSSTILGMSPTVALVVGGGLLLLLMKGGKK